MQIETSKTNKEKFNEFLNKGESPYNYERILMTKHFDRIVHILEGQCPPPYELEIQPSPFCNVKCTHCFGREFERLPDKIGKEQIDKLSDDIDSFEDSTNFKIETIKLCGSTGEPLVNPYASYMLEKFVKKGKYIRLFTNGVSLEDIDYSGKSNLETILKINALNVSLDAGSDEILKKIKGENADYNKIIGSVGKITKERNGKYLEVVISFVISKDNYMDIEKAASGAREAGADIIRYKIDFTSREIKENSSEIIENLEKAKKLETDKFRVASIHSKDDIEGSNPAVFGEFFGNIKCYTSALWSCIGSDFQIYPCGHSCHKQSKPYGSLFEKSFQDLWESKSREEIRKCLPGDSCSFCSPFSLRTNDFLTFLAELPHGEIHEFWS